MARRGVLEILAQFGRPHLSGSYSLSLMTWRDLDIYLEMQTVDAQRFFELGRQLGEALKPHKLSFTDHFDFPTTEAVWGLYWGIRTDLVSRGGWKLDVWGVTPSECSSRLAHCRARTALARAVTLLSDATITWKHHVPREFALLARREKKDEILLMDPSGVQRFEAKAAVSRANAPFQLLLSTYAREARYGASESQLVKARLLREAWNPGFFRSAG